MVKRILSFLNLILITFLLYLGVNVFYKILAAALEAPAVLAPFHESTAAVSAEISPVFDHYQSIIQRNLFNIDTGAKQKPEKLAIETLTQTDLKVKLWGTVTGNDGRPFAVIEESREKKQNLYREGDKIQDAVVKMILREKVVLRVNGKDEILKMEKVKSKGAKPVAGARRVARAPTAPLEQKIILKRSDLEKAMKDSGSLDKEVRIRPHFTNGIPDGLLITGIKPRSIFRKTGIRNGDILTEINDEEVQTQDDALKFYQDLVESDGGTIQIKRRGRVQTIKYTVE